MANKEFQVRHGLIVNNTVLVANTITNNVGIGTATPGYALDVVGTVNAANILINGSPVTGGGISAATLDGANTAVGAGANAWANVVWSASNTYMTATVAGANTAVGAGANAWANGVWSRSNTYMTATVAGANTAVGAGANAWANVVWSASNTYMTATVAGANTAVGAGANAWANGVWSRSNTYMTATVAGANTAVGAGANAWANVVWSSSNTYMTSTIAGANTAVGAGANAWANVVWSASNTYMTATVSGANTAVGAGANAWSNAVLAISNTYMTSTIAGANTAVGAGANNYANATFVRISSSNQVITGNLAVTGSLTVSGNSYSIDTQTLRVSDPLIYLAGNNYVSDILDIGFVGNYVSGNGQNLHTGLFRDATIKEFYLFEGYNQEPEPNHIDPTSNGFTLSVLNATVKTSNLILNGTNALTIISNSSNGANAFAAATIAGANTISIAAFDKANAGPNILIDTVNATRYLVFANNTTGSLSAANVRTSLTFNPSSNNLSVGNTVFATHFDNTSDRNLKENIEPVINGSLILNLNPVSFNWKTTGEKSYGLIAQEVEPVIPEIVHTNDDGMKTIEYVQLISLLISVVQDQQQQIDDINRRLNNTPSNP